MTLLGLLGTGLVVSFSTSIVNAYETVFLEGGGQALVGISGYLTMLARHLLFLALMLVAIYRKPWFIIAIVAAFVLFRFYAGAIRAEFVALLLVMALMLLVRARITTIPWRAAVPALALLWIFDLLGANRLALRQLLAGEASFADLFQSYLATRGGSFGTADFQEFDTATSTIRAVHDLGAFNWGAEYLRLLIWPIPRQLWADKPVATDIIPFQSVGNFQVITRSMVGNFYSDFGAPAVVVGVALIAILCVWIYRRMAETRSVAVYFVGLVFYADLPLLFRDTLVPVAYDLLICLPAVALIVILGKLSFVPAAAAEPAARTPHAARAPA